MRRSEFGTRGYLVTTVAWFDRGLACGNCTPLGTRVPLGTPPGTGYMAHDARGVTRHQCMDFPLTRVLGCANRVQKCTRVLSISTLEDPMSYADFATWYAQNHGTSAWILPLSKSLLLVLIRAPIGSIANLVLCFTPHKAEHKVRTVT